MRTLVRRPLLIVCLFAALIVGCGLWYSLAEGVSPSEGIWWALVTAPTVGYGDIYPVTFWGRLCFVVLAGFSVFFISPLIIANILIHLMPDPNEFTHGEQQALEDSLAVIANKVGVGDEVRRILSKE